MIDRYKIILELKNKLEPLPYINAYWLEGSDANNTVDEYSDIDFWVDFDDEYETETINIVEETLHGISPIDYKYIMDHSHPKIRQIVYHLENTSEYLLIDFCFQLHSRLESEPIKFIKGDMIETPNILFDKNNIIGFKDYDVSEFIDTNRYLLEECKYRYTQHNRVYKYIYRNQFLECYAYYNRYVFEPLIYILRIIYTPAHIDYYLIHISHHLPDDVREKLEYFAKITSTDDIMQRIPEACEWFDKLSSSVDI